MKKLKIATALVLGTLGVQNASAQMVGPHAYIKGTYVEVGVNGQYGYEGIPTTTSPPPAGYHPRSGGPAYFGFVANPQMNGWLTFDGDFFTPGTPENGWGFECISSSGVSFSANNNLTFPTTNFPGTTTYSVIGSCIQADWNATYAGGGYNLTFHINYYLNTADLFYTTTVTVTNNGALIPDFYYYRSFDPDNNVSIAGGTFVTTNTIVSQPGGTCNLAHVKATSTAPASQPLSYVGMAGVGSQFRVSKGGFSNRDGSDIWNGAAGLVGTVGAVSTNDEAISLAYRIQNFAAGASETFKFVMILDDAAATNAINNLFYVTYPGSGASASVCNPTVDTVTTCAGVGVPIGISGSALSSFTWSWTPTTGLTPSTGPTVTAAPLVNTLYTVTGTPTSPCFSPVTQQIYVKVTPGPTIVCAPASKCVGGPAVSLTASGAGVGGTYTWSPATGLSGTTGATVSANPAVTTTYTITGTTSAGCVGTTTVTVTVNPGPTITCPNTSVCSGLGTPLTASGAGVGGTYTWSPATGLSATSGATVTATPAATSTYTITGTTAAGCVGTGTVTVTVNPLPTIACPGGTMCPAGSVVLTASGASTYSWGPSTGLSATTGTSVTATPPSTTTYTVTGTDVNGCVNSTTATVTVGGSASLSVPSATICNGSSTTLTASGASTYTWSPGGMTGSSVTVSPAATTTYTITGTDALGCSGTTTSTVTVNPIPVVNVAPATICNGSSTTLTATGAATYAWSPGGMSGSSITVSPTTTTTYTIDGTTAGCTGTTTATVTVNPVPDVIATPPSATLCSGSTTAIALSSSVAGTAFNWTESSTNVSGASAGSGTSIAQTLTTVTPPSGSVTYTITPSAAGCTGTPLNVTISMEEVVINSINTTDALCNGSTDGVITINATGATEYSIGGAFVPTNVFNVGVGVYSITVQNAGGCQATGTATINEPAALVVPMSQTNETCFGACDGIAGTAPIGGTSPYSYVWSNGATGSPFISGLCSNLYAVTVTDNHGCVQTGSVTISGPPAVTITSVTPAQPSCNGGTNGTITINASATATGFSIDGGATYLPTNTFSGLGAGIYPISVIDANGCTVSTSTTVGQPTALTVVPGLASTVCTGQTATVSATGGGATAPYTYVWTDASGATIGSTANTTVTPSSVGANVYTVTVTDNNGCGPVTSTVTVTVNPPLAVVASPDVSVCPGAPASINAISATGGNGTYTYTWSNSVNATVLTGASQTVTPTASTTTYTLTLTDGCGSPAVSDVVVVSWYALPGVTYTLDNTQGCTPVTVNFASTTSAGATATYNWDFGDGHTSTAAAPTNVFVNDGCYDISLTIVTADGCTVDTVINNQVCVFDYPVPDFTFNPQPTDVFNTEIDFTNLTIGGNTYTWDFAGLGTSTTVNPSYTFPVDGGGTYSVCLNTVSADGCAASICHDVVILDQFIIYVPNSFTPDGDGINDIFLPLIQGENPLSFEFFVFDRWGEVVFKSTDKTIGWDGMYKNIKAKEDVYVWKVRVKKKINEDKLEYNGHVNLLR